MFDVKKAVEDRYKEEEPAPVERRTVNVKEIAAYLDVSIDFIYKLCREKKIPHIKIGAKTMFKIESIEQWLSDLEKNSME